MRLVSVTATTNCRESASGTDVEASATWGAPMTWGRSSTPTPAAAAIGARTNAIRPRPSSVAAAVPTHQIWRAFEIGGGHARQFRRQAQPGRDGERRKPGKAPQQPLAPCHARPAQRERACQQQRKARRVQDVGAGGVERPLEAVGRFPRSGSMVVTRMVMGRDLRLTPVPVPGAQRDRGRNARLARLFVGLRLEDQRNGRVELRQRDDHAHDQSRPVPTKRRARETTAWAGSVSGRGTRSNA